jgi:CheY-like chemotaxis protein
MSQAATTILLAENETLVRIAVADALRDAGFSVIEASSAGDALAVLTSIARDINVLFTDVHMPGDGMDGLQLVHHAAIHWPWVGLLVASGRSLVGPADLPPGCRFLVKPYAPDNAVIHAMELVDKR